MKLALIGTHGVGKTTLVYEVCSLLKKSHHNVELVTEVARQSPFPVNAETTLGGQLWILHATNRCGAGSVTARANGDYRSRRARQLLLPGQQIWPPASAGSVAGLVDDKLLAAHRRSHRRGRNSPRWLPFRRPRISIAHPQFTDRIAGLPPFNNLPAPVIWLDAGDRNNWAYKIVSAAIPLIESSTSTPFRNRAAG